MSRPSCVVNFAELPGEKRPRHTKSPGVAAIVRTLGAATGLNRMGVHLRTVEPGFAGTNRHFHTVEEEWAYVMSGNGRLRIGPREFNVKAGHFAGFPPGPRPHHFVNDGTGGLVFLEGGESRAAEDGCWYPDARMMSRGRKLVEPYEDPPPEEGDEHQLLHIDHVPVKDFCHDVDPGARRQMRTLRAPTDLKRQALYWARVQARDRSTAFHHHRKTDEWVLILSGAATATVGDRSFEVGPNDFIGYPAGGDPHVLEAVTDLTYLMGGQVDPSDLVIYPRHGLKRVGRRLSPFEQ